MQSYVSQDEFFVVSNGSHVIAVRDVDAMTHAKTDSNHELIETSALALAAERFTGNDTMIDKLKVVRVNPADVEDEFPADIGLTPAALRDVAHDLWDDLDNTVTQDAEVIEGWVNVQRKLTVSQVLKHLSDPNNPPARLHRGPDAYEAAVQPYKAVATQVAALLSLLTDDVFSSDPANAEKVAQIKAVAEQLKVEVPSDAQAVPRVIHRDVLQSWEVGHGCADDNGLTAEQRQPWVLQVEPSSEGIRVAMWPAASSGDEVNVGLDALFEIRKGHAAVSIAPAYNQAHAVHVISTGPNRLEVSPDTGRHIAIGSSSHYDGCQAAVFSN